ncbi:MAG: hypothetical protein ABEJ46_04785 [Gemmatimonadota bacterium]
MKNRLTGPGGFDLSDREYPQSWFLLDVVDEEPQLVGQEVVDLSPGAIELRTAARELRDFAEERGRWLPLGAESNVEGIDGAYRRQLSFGPSVRYCVEHDEREELHAGRPIRHLCLDFDGRRLTPATSAEIALYFFGRRPAAFGFTSRDRAHGFIGLEWEPVSREDLQDLLSREMEA